MIASSVFVLTALTMTGVYMQSRDQGKENDGYTIDFSTLENNVDEKNLEIAEYNRDENNSGDSSILGETADNIGLDDAMDYTPMEAGSNLVEIPGLTDGQVQSGTENGTSDDQDEKVNAKGTNGTAEGQTVAEAEEPTQMPDETVTPSESAETTSYGTSNISEQDAMGENVRVAQELHFSESNGLLQPMTGEHEVLIPYSMDSGVYFMTLEHYKRNDAMMIAAPEGTTVTACADGKVINIFQDSEYGHAVTMELGDGYEITYGQLRDIKVSVGSYVNAGDSFATVAKTTKYYVREGDNLYLKLTLNGTALDPSELLR